MSGKVLEIMYSNDISQQVGYACNQMFYFLDNMNDNTYELVLLCVTNLSFSLVTPVIHLPADVVSYPYL